MRLLRTAGIAASLLFSVVAASGARAYDVDTIVKKLQSGGDLTIGYRESIPPTGFLGTDGKPAGYAIDFCTRIVDLVRQDMGLKAINVKYVPVTLQTRQALVANGTVDLECGGTVITFARMKQVDFTPVSYVASNQFLALKAANIKSLSDLNGKIVAVAASGNSGPELKTLIDKEKLNIRIVNVDDHAAALIGIESHRIDAYFSDNSAFYGLMKQSRHPELLAIVGPEIGYAPQGFMIPKNNPMFLWYVSHAMAKMFASGEAEANFTKWYEPLGGSLGPSLKGAWATYSFPE
jgi:glutamate/aspartate transport system substrate-binding protein